MISEAIGFENDKDEEVNPIGADRCKEAVQADGTGRGDECELEGGGMGREQSELRLGVIPTVTEIFFLFLDHFHKDICFAPLLSRSVPIDAMDLPSLRFVQLSHCFREETSTASFDFSPRVASMASVSCSLGRSASASAS